MHQRFGPCGVPHVDITGAVVVEYVCAEAFEEDFSFDCVAGLAHPRGPARSALLGGAVLPPPRARSHYRFALPLIHCIPYSQV